ncbi:multidrug transporter MatE [Heyndrickxia shackletonii]|uniref:Multidrug transporter MatE n=1 Tax=Heyndrickxia shackletonii TaxID=157838 RepID=A0A0Q3WS25_9BACI|nr:polysaccharide biosynthesis protein [Heyndrickxia shackletonii]KQL50668.1 multidrug transporter MatE [Heyndrickxia shackletonii]MBB2479909.1 polysaccharide biosynthesis protein [Bacillus sp. APMAM]NEY98004.1 polysaccharide biosynthesis protein [Heyndrickxia shackletonii]RTZ56604.1 polysaccharide biosynthesis protein [Bacillus sp. SAJ1]
MRSFFKGIFVLAVVAFLGECIEFLVNMVLAKELGGVGMGLYMSILPLVFFVVVLASMELTVSISKYIAEKEEKYHASMLRHGIRFSAFFTIVLTIVTICVLPIIPVFNQYHPYIRLLVIILIPITSFSSIARGYFMGVQHMGKIAVANFTRKFAQLILLVLIYHLFQFDLNVSILIALCALVGSEIIVLIYLLQQFYVQMKYMKKNKGNIRLSGKNVRKSLLSVSLPTTGMRISHSIAHAIQPFLIKAALVKAGLTGTVALEHFGIVTGVAFSIGFFPAFIAHSFSTVLIPTVSEAYAKKDFVRLQKLLQQIMFMTFLYGVPAVIIFHYFAEPLTHLFFKSALAPLYLQLLWPYFLFHYFVIPLQAFLIGIGLITDSLIHYIWATIVMFVIMYILGSNPHYQMIGIILAMNTSSLLLMLLHYITICRKIGVSIILRKPIKQSY